MNKIGQRIKDWGQRFHPLDQNTVDRLTGNIMGAIHASQLRTNDKSIQYYCRQLWGTRLALAVVSMVLCLIVLHDLAPMRGAHQVVKKISAPDRDELNELRVALKEMRGVFPEGIQWLDRQGGTMNIHPQPIGRMKPNSSVEMVLIAFTIVQKQEGKSETVERQDLIAKTNEQIEWGNGHKSMVWTFPVDAQYVSVDLNKVFYVGESQVKIQNHFLQPFNEQRLIAQTVVNDKHYEIYQAVCRL